MEWNDQKDTSTYILFDKIYEFKYIPNSFMKGDRDNKTVIESLTNLIENGKLRDRFEFERELDIKLKELNDWVNNLPSIK